MDNHTGLAAIAAKDAPAIAGLVTAAMAVEPIIQVLAYIFTISYTAMLIWDWIKGKRK